MCSRVSVILWLCSRVSDSAAVSVLTRVCVLMQTHMAICAQTFRADVYTRIDVCAGPGVPTTCDSVAARVLTCAVEEAVLREAVRTAALGWWLSRDHCTLALSPV